MVAHDFIHAPHRNTTNSDYSSALSAHYGRTRTIYPHQCLKIVCCPTGFNPLGRHLVLLFPEKIDNFMLFLRLAYYCVGEDGHRPGHRSLDHPKMVPQMLKLLIQHPRMKLPYQPPSGSLFVGETLAGFGLPSTAANLNRESWHPGTRAPYESLLRGWSRLCCTRHVHPMSHTTYDILVCLNAVLNTPPLLRSKLSSVILSQSII